MIKLEHTEVAGWGAAIRGMRNPMNSWDKSDSGFRDIITGNLVGLDGKLLDPNFVNANMHYDLYECPDFIGPADQDLMIRLARAGSVDAKYRRMINVTVDITAPLYWWKEFDTYKVGTVANSCSTMHKIHAKEFTLDDFSWDQLLNTGCDLFTEEKQDGFCKREVQPIQFMIDYIIPVLNMCREKFLETKDKAFWWQMIQLLPTSYNQKRTVQLNYEVLAGIYPKRKNHKLDEWREFCAWIKTLPYSEVITLEE